MKYKALILDIDGTLTLPMTKDRKNPLPSQKVINAIRLASTKVHIALATARSITLAMPVFTHLQLSGLCILQSGALIINGLTGETLWEKTISPENFLQITSFLTKHKFSFKIDEKTKSGISFSPEYQPKKVLTIFVSELTDKQADFVEKNLSHISGISLHKVTSWTPSLWGFNITSDQASKQHAVLELLRILNLYPEELIGVGDHYSDFPLLMACGLKVAMGNAVPELKAIADYIAPSVDEDGVADVIEKFVLTY